MRCRVTALVSSLLLFLIGCGGSPGDQATPARPPATTKKGAGANPPASNDPLSKYDISLPEVTYAWDPKAGDPSVPAELGGPGFTGEGWETNMTFPALGSAKAKKGGQLRMYLPDWPATLRQAGKDWNQAFNYMATSLCYQSLLQIHPTTLKFIPNLATHWQISKDKMTYRFRINPAARWSDGSEVTADDVVATYKLLMDPTLLDPSAILTYGKLNPPKAISKYIVEVAVKEENWRNFLYFSSMTVFPAKEVSIKGSEYLKKYQSSYTASPGPYLVDVQKSETGASLLIRRRKDWWDDGNPAWTGMHNFDEIKVFIIKNPQLAFEKVKKGELDFYIVPKAQWWVEEIPGLDPVKRGLLQMHKIYNDAPVGTSGLAINMTRPPLDDVRLRLALCYLYDRATMIKKLYFNEYLPLSSYWQGGLYQNRDNKTIPYDEFKAVALLEEAGWTEKNQQGYRVKEGRELHFTVTYSSPLSERSLTVFQEACKKAGIGIDLQLLTPAAAWKNLTQREYDLASVAWGGLTFPNPETSFHSRLAATKNNNNVTGFADKRVDELCAMYDKEYDVAKRVAIIREIDGIIFQKHPYVLGWYGPSQRFLTWRQVQMPKFGTFRTFSDLDMIYNWWIDPDIEQQIDKGKQDQSVSLPREPIKNFWWKAWNRAQERARKGKG